MKIEKVSEDVLAVFETAFQRTGLEQYIEIDFLSKKMKNEIYKVYKTNEYTKYKTNSDCVIYVDEEIFSQLSLDQQNIIADEALCGLSFDSEKDIFNIIKPNISTFSGVLKKYSSIEVLNLKESINLALESREQAEKERKERKKK
jgi:hypothetical protein